MTIHASHDPGSDLVDRLARLIGGGAGVTTVFGSPVERDGVTVIPVARTRFGFGGGGGPAPDGRGEGAGGGGGAASRPLGFIEIRGGRARFRRVTDPVALGIAAIAIATAVAILARVARRVGGCGTRQGRGTSPTIPPSGRERISEYQAPQ